MCTSGSVSILLGHSQQCQLTYSSAEFFSWMPTALFDVLFEYVSRKSCVLILTLTRTWRVTPVQLFLINCVHSFSLLFAVA